MRSIDNLQVTVKNIHVRLESMERKWDFSMGILVNRVEVFTINEQGQRHFFTRAKHHRHLLHHHKSKHHHDDDVLYKKVEVSNVDLYFVEYEREFLTLVQNKEAVLKMMKGFLDGDRDTLMGEEQARNEPNVVLRLRLEAILRAQLNQNSKYDIDIKTSLCPLLINLTDRMTAEIFYFLQVAF